jgi:hypothetical protein
MPQFNTGSSNWDQALGNLSGALFPDPSKQVEAYYYGANARKAQVETAKAKNALAAAHAVDAQLGGNNAAPTYDPGEAGTTIMHDPYAAGTPPTSPPTAIPATPGTGGMLAQAVAPGPSGTPLTPGAPGASGANAGNNLPPGSTNGPPVPPSVVVSKLADAAAGATSGPLPESSPPSAVAGPSSNRTTTNGQVPDKNYGAGPIAPGSVGTGDGGPTFAGPAKSTGGHADPAFNYATLYSKLIQSGATDAQANAQLRAVILNAVASGKLPQASAEAMAAFAGEPSMQNTRTAGQNAQNLKGMDPVTTTDPVTGQSRIDPLSTIIARGGMPTMNPDQQKAATTYGQFTSPTDPTNRTTMSFPEAAAKGLPAAPTDQGQVSAQLDYAILHAPNEQERQRLVALKSGVAPVVGGDKAKEDSLVQQLLDKQLAKNFTPPSGWNAPGTQTDQGAASADLERVFKGLEDQYYQAGGRRDHVLAANQAYQQLVDEKYIDPKQSRDEGVFSKSMTMTKIDKDNNPHPYFRVEMMQPGTNTPYEAGKAPMVQMRTAGAPAATPVPPASTLFTPRTSRVPPAATTGLPPAPASGGGGMPPGALARAPAGAPEGSIGNSAKYGRVRVVNGFYFPAQ